MRQGCRTIIIDNMSGIMCGGETTDHECDEKATIYGFSDGFSGTLFTKVKQEKLNLQMCDEDKLYFLSEKGIDLVSMSVACSICGRAAIDNAWYL